MALAAVALRLTDRTVRAVARHGGQGPATAQHDDRQKRGRDRSPTVRARHAARAGPLGASTTSASTIGSSIPSRLKSESRMSSAFRYSVMTLFTRHYSYQEKGANGAQHLYRYECIRLKVLDSVATAYGRTDELAKTSLYDDLRRKGLMPAKDAD